MSRRTVPLYKVANLESGFGFPREYQGDENQECPFFRVSDMNIAGNEVFMENHSNTVSAEILKELGARAFPAGTVIFPKIGAAIATEKKRILTKPATYDNNVMGAVPKVGTNPKFLYYWFLQLKLSDQANPGHVPSIRKSVMEEIPFPVVAPSEQLRIVELLDEADRLRRLRREADAKAARILPALFLKMFGDPATNLMGWPTNRLDSWFDVFGGGTPSKANDEYWKGDIPWVSPKDMKVDVIQETEDHITQDAIANSATKLVDPGSVLIVYRSGILAHTFPVAIAGRALTLNQDLKALASRGEVLNEFIYGWLISGQKLALSCVKKGATVHNIDGPRFLGLQVPKPPRHLQEDFARHLQALFLLKIEREGAAQKVETLFGLLLQKAFSGQLTAKWRQSHMQELLAEMTQQARLLNLPMPEELEALA